jgi:hypothetical protein
MDANHFLAIFVDHVAPKLDTYEQAIYLYLVRNGPLLGQSEIVFPIESGSMRLALGIAKRGARISRDVVRRKLQSLQDKGFVRILGTEYRGTRVACFLPEEIGGLLPTANAEQVESVEERDFFIDPKGREAIFRRDGNRCFYCARTLTPTDRVLDHVVPQANVNNSYRNLVASCLTCNSRKGNSTAPDLVRTLFRERILDEGELKVRLSDLDRLSSGKLKPLSS